MPGQDEAVGAGAQLNVVVVLVVPLENTTDADVVVVVVVVDPLVTTPAEPDVVDTLVVVVVTAMVVVVVVLLVVVVIGAYETSLIEEYPWYIRRPLSMPEAESVPVTLENKMQFGLLPLDAP